MRNKTAKKTSMSKRGLGLMAAIMIVGVLLIGRLAYFQLVKGEYYSALVESNQYKSSELKADRGKIYDANMKVLAQSASVWRVSLDPSRFNNIDETYRDEIRVSVSSELAEILDMDKEKILEYTYKNIGYQKLKDGIEKEQKDQILALIEKYNSREENSVYLGNIIRIESDSKRYYTYDSLASTVIGFTGADGKGLYGIEHYYNDVLSGVPGQTITAYDGKGNEMPNQYETIYESQEGAGLVLTVDMYVQNVLETVLSDAYTDTGAENVYGIVMDVETGAILAMASFPDYNLNDPYTLKSEALYDAYIEATTQQAEESTDADADSKNTSKLGLKDFQNIQWSNRTITSTYEAGSVIKVITAAASYEEGLATLDRQFFCSGIINYASRNIKCWRAGGHGSETFEDLLKNSCNPFAVTLASELGQDTFYDYFEAFGFTEKTGVNTSGDLTPKAGVLYKARENFTKSDLASYSFGQTFQVSPLQVITAISAIANGGKLMTPYIVSKQVDADQNVISEIKPTVRRQVVSEETANVICDIMQEVVSTGTGKNAYVEGYRVAGKTGTSEKLTDEEEVYIASFCGFAPADDPEISVIIIVDEPEGEHGGGAVAAPLAREVFEQVLPYLGVEKSYTDAEAARLVEKAPNLIGKSVADAKTSVAGSSLSVKIVGDGDTVVSQYPDSGREIPYNGMIILYTDEEKKSSTVTVPDFSNCTLSQANKLAINSGLNIKINGSSLGSDSVYAYKQSIQAGTTVNMGEIITVYFKTNVNVGD